MAQPLHNPLSFLKSANTSNSSLERSPSTRSRSGSFLRAISFHSPHPSSTPNQGNQSPTTVSLSRTNTNSSAATSFSRFPTINDETTTEFAFSCNPEDFEIKNPIGYGSSAVVYNATYKPKNMRIAIKMIDLDLFERNQIDELRRETALMALSKHPNVLKVYGSFVNGSKLYIATPYLSGGSCLDIMKSGFQDGFEEVIIATILKQALEGLFYLHKNGHIHRDVKAGNLLMDDQGTVLLADFGVSSSLTENNEVRKTFVGTPCWMAPEVMEQSGYDFKADIWSFGITALELVTGHAPFAKFPPMKVLMMTLNQSPPTLNRDHAKHKYTRMFKEMIDLCLHKDPSKRPTAEKLLLHPFFKQAKRKDYLIKTVLACVPPLDQRPHKKLGFKQTTIEHTAQWDFDTPAEEDDGHEIDNKKVDPKPASSNNKSAPIQKPQQHISFGNVIIKNERSDLPSPAPSDPEITSPMPVRKSRFVIEESHSSDNSNTSIDKDESTSQRSLSPNNLSSHSNNEIVPPKPATSIFMNDASPPNITENSWQSSMGLGLGISSTSAAVAASLQQQPQQENVEVKKGRFSVNQQAAPPSIRTTNIGVDPKNELTVGQTPFQAPESPLDTRSLSMSRIASNDSMRGERKSRFEVQHLPTPTTPQLPINNPPVNISPPPAIISHGTLDNREVKFETVPMTREASVRHQRSLSRESVNSGKVSRFSIEKEDGSVQQPELVHPFETVPTAAPGSPECRKKGRFELTGGMTTAERLESPQTTLNGTSSQASIAASIAAAVATPSTYQRSSSDQPQQALSHLVYGHMDALLKQTETQKAMLHDLLFGLNTISNGGLPHNIPTSRGRSSSFDIRKMSNSSMEHLNGLQHNNLMEARSSIPNDIASTMEHIQQLLLTSGREKERLLKENEALKREVERLRKQQLPPSVSTHIAPTAGILKSSVAATPSIPPTPSVSLTVADKSEPCTPIQSSTHEASILTFNNTNHDKQ